MTDTNSQDANGNSGVFAGENEGETQEADGAFNGENQTKPKRKFEDKFTDKYPPPLDLGNDSNAADFFINQIMSGKLLGQMIPRIQFSLKVMSNLAEGAADSFAAIRERVGEIRERRAATNKKLEEINKQKQQTAEKRKEEEKRRKEEEKRKEEERKRKEAEAQKKRKQNPQQIGADASKRKDEKNKIAQNVAQYGRKRQQQKQGIDNWKTLQRNLVRANDQSRGRMQIRQQSRGGRG